MTLREKSTILVVVGMWIPIVAGALLVGTLALTGMYIKARLKGVGE